MGVLFVYCGFICCVSGVVGDVLDDVRGGDAGTIK